MGGIGKEGNGDVMGSSKGEVIILGIESSCDETSAAVLVNGTELRSHVISSQIATHQRYGGVVPEIASREHILHIQPVVQQLEKPLAN